MNARHIAICVLIAAAAGAAEGQQSRFYQACAAEPTEIVSFDRQGILTLSSEASPPACRIDWADSPHGPWSPAPLYATVARLGGQTTLWLATDRGDPSADILDVPRMWDCARHTIYVGDIPHRLDVYAWRDFMPGPSPPSGLLATLVVSAPAGQQLSPELHPVAIRLIRQGDTWTPPVWEVRHPSAQRAEFTVRGGPYWTPGERISVRLVLALDDDRHLLATAATIARTE